MKRKPKSKKALRHNEYYDMQGIFDSLYEDSKNGVVMKGLMEIITRSENIELAYRNIKNNPGANTPGTDGRTIKYLSRLNPDGMVALVHNKLRDFKPQKVRRVEIPKPDGTNRPLGIPTITDRLIQQCILQVLDPICEAKFYKDNYGFRPLRGAKQAIARAYQLMQISNLHYVVDIDIKGFFDNIDHGKLLKQIWALGIRDKRLLAIISAMLKADVEGIGKPTKGTPQGGILSPLLANIALNEFDNWIDSQWDGIRTKHEYVTQKGSTCGKQRRLRQSTTLKEIHIVRYADDFKLFCRTHSDAVKVFNASQQWLLERLKLEISPTKSKIVNLKKDYSEFLGIKMKVIRKGFKRWGDEKLVVKSHISDKAKNKIKHSIQQKTKSIAKKDNHWKKMEISKLNAYIIGIHDYYSCATHISKDLNRVAYDCRYLMENRLKLRRVKQTDLISAFIQKTYGNSRSLRSCERVVIAPLDYAQHKKVMLFNQCSPYVEKERASIHDSLKGISTKVVIEMMNNLRSGNMEYCDNRISKYVSQNGKCAILKTVLEKEDIHCHHKMPRHIGGSDKYDNLVIIHEDIHRLVHATDETTISKYLEKLKLTKQQLERVNGLREQAELTAI